MPVAIGVSTAVAASLIFAVSQVDMQKVLKTAEKKIMKVVEPPKPIEPPPPPPPPPPPEVKKIVQPQQQPEIASPPPDNIPAVDNAGADAPAVGTVGATGPATAPPVNPPSAASPAIQQAGVVCSNASAPDGNRMLRDLKLNEITGEVTLRITIDGAGHVTDTAVTSSNTQPVRAADRYLQRHASRYKCQASGGTIIAEQTFVFKFE
jgi:protein TonB